MTKPRIHNIALMLLRRLHRPKLYTYVSQEMLDIACWHYRNCPTLYEVESGWAIIILQ